MFEPTELSVQQWEMCLDTISPNTFYMMAVSALLKKEVLSVVRFGDGEKLLLDRIQGIPPTPGDRELTDDWLERMGCAGIDMEVLHRRMKMAANECTFFAPSISGIIRREFDLYSRFPTRYRYVDNFFVNAWDEEMKINLFKTAGRVLFIHRNPETADAMQIRAQKIGVVVEYLRLNDWLDTERLVIQAKRSQARLVLFSAGPASKYMGHRIAATGIPKVSLDIGNAADMWTLSSLA